jgi:hypothetical protein
MLKQWYVWSTTVQPTITIEVPQHSETGGTSTMLVQRTQKKTDQVSFKNTVITTLSRCLQRDEEKKGDKSRVIDEKRDLVKSRPPSVVQTTYTTVTKGMLKNRSGRIETLQIVRKRAVAVMPAICAQAMPQLMCRNPGESSATCEAGCLNLLAKTWRMFDVFFAVNVPSGRVLHPWHRRGVKPAKQAAQRCGWGRSYSKRMRGRSWYWNHDVWSKLATIAKAQYLLVETEASRIYDIEQQKAEQSWLCSA